MLVNLGGGGNNILGFNNRDIGFYILGRVIIVFLGGGVSSKGVDMI